MNKRKENTLKYNRKDKWIELNDPSGPWTIFAPDNDAFQSLPSETFDHIMKDPVLLKQILMYHIAPLNATRQSFTNNERLLSLYENHPIHINLYSDGWASVSWDMFTVHRWYYITNIKIL